MVNCVKHMGRSVSKIAIVGEWYTLGSYLIAEASDVAHPHQIRTLLAIILTTCFPSNPSELWTKYQDRLSEDILHRVWQIHHNPEINFTPEIYNEALIAIEDLCLTIANKTLIQLGMPSSNRSMHNDFDQELQHELQYDCVELNICRNKPSEIECCTKRGIWQNYACCKR